MSKNTHCRDNVFAVVLIVLVSVTAAVVPGMCYRGNGLTAHNGRVYREKKEHEDKKPEDWGGGYHKRAEYRYPDMSQGRQDYREDHDHQRPAFWIPYKWNESRHGPVVCGVDGCIPQRGQAD